MNSWNFTGNLGSDADMKTLSSGDAIVNFNVAVKAGYGDKATTTWVRCSIFGKRGEVVAQYLTKGTQVGIVGEAQLRPWTDKDGVEKSSLEVRVNDLTLLGSKDRDQAPRQAAQQARQGAAKPAANFEDLDGEIPF